MGGTLYSFSDRAYRTKTYKSAKMSDIFVQTNENRIHQDMEPKGIRFRESRDSDVHPETLPIQLYLDVTGSMGHIPHHLIKDGLPSLMSDLIENGIEHAALMFGAIGDHITDRHPLQVGQFESGDKELDLWLTRTFIEGRGGGNAGESYPLAWYFSGKHVVTDSFEKRNKKGYVFTVGDEPFLGHYSESAIRSIMGDTAIPNTPSGGSYTAAELLNISQRKNHVYHIFIEHGRRRCDDAWRELLGDNLIVTEDYQSLSRIISDVILKNESVTPSTVSDILNTDSENFIL
jgi:hypothetical protein